MKRRPQGSAPDSPDEQFRKRVEFLILVKGLSPADAVVQGRHEYGHGRGAPDPELRARTIDDAVQVLQSQVDMERARTAVAQRQRADAARKLKAAEETNRALLRRLAELEAENARLREEAATPAARRAIDLAGVPA